jgi:hypothetical protein
VRFLLPEQLLPTLNRKDGLQIDQKKPESSRIKPAMFHRVDQYWSKINTEVTELNTRS